MSNALKNSIINI